jgi:hypothetical protein
MTEINGLSVYEPRDPLPFTVRVFDADGNEIPTSGRRCTEPDCQRPLADGLICHVCHERLKLVGELNDLRLELITRNDEIAALVAALRDVTDLMWSNVDSDEVLIHIVSASKDGLVGGLYDTTANAYRRAQALLKGKP